MNVRMVIVVVWSAARLVDAGFLVARSMTAASVRSSSTVFTLASIRPSTGHHISADTDTYPFAVTLAGVH